MHTIKQAAELAAQGFRIVPTNGHKSPLVGGFGADNPTFTLEPQWFGEPGSKVGILCGACPALGPEFLLLCLDLDGNVAGCPVLCEFLSSLPGTLTSHGGRHLFFAVPAARAGALKQWADAFGTKAAFGAAIDLKWSGGFAEESWDWAPETDLADLPSQIADLPDAALDALVVASGAVVDNVAGIAHDHRGQAYLESNGHDYANVLLDAEKWLRTSAPLPVPGNGSDALLVVIGGLMVGFGLSDEVAAELAADVYYDRAWKGEPVDDEQLWHKIETIQDQGSHTFTELELAALYRNMRSDHAALAAAASPVEPGASPAPAAKPHPEEDMSGCVLCPLSGWPYILQKANRFWLHKVGVAEYHPEIGPTELEADVARRLANQVAASCSALKDLRKAYIKPVRTVRTTYCSRTSTYDPDTDTLTSAALEWAPLHPAFHDHVDAWLRAMWGEEYTRGAQWLAALPRLDRPAPCLYLSGPKDVGKGLLADGLAALWSVTRPGSLREVVGNFNSCLQTCPLVFGDEGFPEKMSFDWFREAITNRTQRVNIKNQREYNLEGCARFIVAANNDESLRYQRTGTLTRQDVEAIADRLLAIPCLDGARAELAKMDLVKAATRDIAEHTLWLAMTVPLEPPTSRMAARANAGERLLTNIISARYQEMLELVQPIIEAARRGTRAEDAQGREEWCWVDIEEVLVRVNVPALHARCKMLEGTKISLNDVRGFCASHAKRQGAVQWKGLGRNIKVRELDLGLLQAGIDSLS